MEHGHPLLLALTVGNFHLKDELFFEDPLCLLLDELDGDEVLRFLVERGELRLEVEAFELVLHEHLPVSVHEVEDRLVLALHDLLVGRVVRHEEDSLLPRLTPVCRVSMVEVLVDALFVALHLLPLFLVSEAEDEELLTIFTQQLGNEVLLLLRTVEGFRVSNDYLAEIKLRVLLLFHNALMMDRS